MDKSSMKIQKQITLYHGSKAEFTQFDESKISTGDSSDFFGKGFYLTDSKSVADFYAHQIAKKEFITHYTPTGIFKTDEPHYEKDADAKAAKNKHINRFVVTGKILDSEKYIISEKFKQAIITSFDKYSGFGKESAERVFDYMRTEGNKEKINEYRGELWYVIKQLGFADKQIVEDIVSFIKGMGYIGVKYPSDRSYEVNEWGRLNSNAYNYVIYDSKAIAPADKPLEIDFKGYDKYIVTFSGGKDSTATFLHLLELGIPKEKIELWHQEIDGRGRHFFDWEVTTAYCRAFAVHFGVPIYFSWKEGGFYGEMMRDNAKTAPIVFEDENKNLIKVGGKDGKILSRKMFPQLSPDLSVRWCSSYLKIDVNGIAIRNQSRFSGIKTVVISGERGEESANRAQYAELEPDRADNRGGKYVDRYVDRIRSIKNWSEEEVWKIIERWKVRVHPAYYMGWGRVSCKWCIYGNKNQFASAYHLSPEQGDEIVALEKVFGKTIKRDRPLSQLIQEGKPYEAITEELKAVALSKEYPLSIVMDKWELPAGAFSKDCEIR
jgi:3'-phosphoadenosine 5'-phosphosulfate sulfotransferase (PAPS reductase)/FAD synthetase